jgi:hypothetical protein
LAAFVEGRNHDGDSQLAKHDRVVSPSSEWRAKGGLTQRHGTESFRTG